MPGMTERTDLREYEKDREEVGLDNVLTIPVKEHQRQWEGELQLSGDLEVLPGRRGVQGAWRESWLSSVPFSLAW